MPPPPKKKKNKQTSAKISNLLGISIRSSYSDTRVEQIRAGWRLCDGDDPPYLNSNTH